MRLGICESRGCSCEAVGFDDDGRSLCADCMFEGSIVDDADDEAAEERDDG